MPSILANTAIGVFFPQPLLMVLALVPVVVVETVALRNRLSVGYRQVLAANAISTLCGLPLAYFAVVAFNIANSGGNRDWWPVGFHGRVMSHGLHHWWILPLAMVSVLVPCFVLSVLIEGGYLAKRSPQTGRRVLWLSVIRAHCYSYLVLIALDCLWMRAMISD